MGAKGAIGPCKASWALNDLTAVLLLHVTTVKVRDLDSAYGLSGLKKDELVGRLFVRGEIVELVRTDSLTSARELNGLEYIRICATPPKKLVFCDDVQVLIKS